MALHQEVIYSKSFSQLAREADFSFNLYRGRVDWKKLEVLDVDRLVRDQDVELLNTYINSVTNCNLESEYDLKILDPNFIKLFRIAQLLIDFLLHCKQYLERCIKVAYENLQASNKEVEALRKQLHDRKCEVKNLKKNIKQLKEQLFILQRISRSSVECYLCGKLFMSEKYLESHHSRRHFTNQYPFPSKTAEPHKVPIVHEENKNEQKSENVTNLKKRYQEEIKELKSIFFAEIEKLKQNGVTKKQLESKCDVIVSEAKPKTAKDSKCEQEDPDEIIQRAQAEEEWRRKLEERENVWRARLSEQGQQHRREVQQLQEMLDSTQLQGQEIKKDMEHRLEEVLGKLEQSQKALLESSNEMKKKDPSTQGNGHEDENVPVISLVENMNEGDSKHIPTFSKRRAFVTQKTKTIADEDLIEPIQHTEGTSDVQVIDQTYDDEIYSDPTKSAVNLDTNMYVEKRSTHNELKSNISEQKIIINTHDGSPKSVEDKSVNVISNVTNYLASEVIEDNESTTESESDVDSAEEQQPEERNSMKTLQANTNRIQTNFYQNVLKECVIDNLARNNTSIAQQSFLSMEAILVSNPTILQQLRSDLQELVGRRLRGLGVDPSWTTLPPHTFRTKVAVLAHHRQITAKNHKVYFSLREKLNQDADSEVRSQSSKPIAESLLARLRKKVYSSAKEATLSHHEDKIREVAQQNPSPTPLVPQPLASSSPQHITATGTSSRPRAFEQYTTSIEIPKIALEDSLSLSSTTSEEIKVAAPKVVYKSALRNAVSTGNISKKKVIFVDEAIKDNKRSLSESTVAISDSFSSRLDNVSVSSLVQEIQTQLNERSARPAHSVDVSQPTELPLSQMLPLSRTGRALLALKSPPSAKADSSTSPSQSSVLNLTATVGQLSSGVPHLTKSEPSNVVKKPIYHSGFSSDLKMPTSQNPQLQLPQLSPTQSLSSISSCLDTNNSLELDLQDLEDNFKD